jgi:hypothetical protein
MVAFFTQLLLAIRSRFSRRARLEAENLILRQQLVVLRCKSSKRVRLWNNDRLRLRFQVSTIRRGSAVRRQRVLAAHLPDQRSNLGINPWTAADVAGLPPPVGAEADCGWTMMIASQGWKTFLRNHAAGIARVCQIVKLNQSSRHHCALALIQRASLDIALEQERYGRLALMAWLPFLEAWFEFERRNLQLVAA